MKHADPSVTFWLFNGYHTTSIRAGGKDGHPRHNVQVTVSPFERSVQIFVDGERVYGGR